MPSNRREQLVRQRFERHAKRYGRNPMTAWVGRHELRAMYPLIPPAPQPNLTPALDFGCGPGRATAMLLEKGYRVTGYDISPAMVNLAHDVYGDHPNAFFTTDRAAVQGRWPVIVSLGVMDYYPQGTPLWQDWEALLASTGTLVMTAPNSASPLAWIYTLASRFSCPARPASVERLMQEAASANLRVTAVRAAFPSHLRLGHTLVLQLQLSQTDSLAKGI